MKSKDGSGLIPDPLQRYIDAQGHGVLDESQKERIWQGIEQQLMHASPNVRSHRRYLPGSRKTRWMTATAASAAVIVFGATVSLVRSNQHSSRGPLLPSNTVAVTSRENTSSTTHGPDGSLSTHESAAVGTDASAEEPISGPNLAGPDGSDMARFNGPRIAVTNGVLSNKPSATALSVKNVDITEQNLPFSFVGSGNRSVLLGHIPAKNGLKDGSTTVLYDMQNHAYTVPDTTTAWEIYGLTPTDDVILGYPAGGGGVGEVVRPGQGIIKKFPGTKDKNAHWTYAASESTQGYWAEQMASSDGSGPGQRLWFDIDEKPVGALKGTRWFEWSPDGSSLAAIVDAPNSNLIIYDASQKKTLFSSGWYTYGTLLKGSDNALNPQTNTFLGWSTDGRYVATSTDKGLVVVDTNHLSTQKPFLSSTVLGLVWGFIGPDVLYSVNQNSNQVTLFHISNRSVSRVKTLSIQGTITKTESLGDGRALFLTNQGIVYVVSAAGMHPVVNGVYTCWYNGLDDSIYYIPDKTRNKVWRISAEAENETAGGGSK